MNTTHIKTILILIGSILVLSTSINVLAANCSYFATKSLDEANSATMASTPISISPSECIPACFDDSASVSPSVCMQNIYNYIAAWDFNAAFSTTYGNSNVGAANPQSNGSQLGATNSSPPTSISDTISSTVNHATNSNPLTTTQPNTNTQTPNNQSDQQQTKTNTVRWL